MLLPCRGTRFILIILARCLYRRAQARPWDVEAGSPPLAFFAKDREDREHVPCGKTGPDRPSVGRDCPFNLEPAYTPIPPTRLADGLELESAPT
jgi:hypothetical protein